MQFKSRHSDQNRQILRRNLSIFLYDIYIHYSIKEFPMENQDYLSEDEIIKGVENYLSQKGRTVRKRLIKKATASSKQHGIDLVFKLENDRGNGNWYFIEAKGNKRSDGAAMKSAFHTNFRWAISQIVLRIKVDPRKYNYIYGIAVPQCEIDKCIQMIHDNWALKHLKIRLYGVSSCGDTLFANEYVPSKIYD